MTKQFTIPCQFGNQISPVTFYIGHPDPAHHPIKFQSDWLSSSKGGTVPQDLMITLQKLHDLAIENNADFEELCYYSLVTATSNANDGITPETITNYADEFVKKELGGTSLPNTDNQEQKIGTNLKEVLNDTDKNIEIESNYISSNNKKEKIIPTLSSTDVDANNIITSGGSINTNNNDVDNLENDSDNGLLDEDLLMEDDDILSENNDTNKVENIQKTEIVDDKTDDDLLFDDDLLDESDDNAIQNINGDNEQQEMKENDNYDEHIVDYNNIEDEEEFDKEIMDVMEEDDTEEINNKKDINDNNKININNDNNLISNDDDILDYNDDVNIDNDFLEDDNDMEEDDAIDKEIIDVIVENDEEAINNNQDNNDNNSINKDSTSISDDDLLLED